MWTGPLAFLCTDEWMMRPVTPSTRKMPMKVRSWCTSVLCVTTASRLGFKLWGEGGKGSLRTTMANHELNSAVSPGACCPEERPDFLVRRLPPGARLPHTRSESPGAVCHAGCLAYISPLSPINSPAVGLWLPTFGQRGRLQVVSYTTCSRHRHSQSLTQATSQVCPFTDLSLHSSDTVSLHQCPPCH